MENGNKKNQETKKKKEKQKKDEARKKISQSPKDPQEKIVNKITHHSCIHHMAWTAQKPKDCRLGKDQSENMKPSSHTTFCSNVATVES